MTDRLMDRGPPSPAAHRAPPAGLADHPLASVSLSSFVVYLIVVGLWLAFGATLLVDSGSLVDFWDRFRGWPLVIQGVVALLLLPWVVASWVWQTDWPLALRLALDAGLAWATLYAFFPLRR